jgi:tetratricopeptide (TPR) repeat protein
MSGRTMPWRAFDGLDDRFDRVIEWLLISLLAFMPLALGAVEAWSEQVVLALAAAISITFLAKLVFSGSRALVWSWIYVPVVLFVFLAVFQLLPLPSDVVGMLSPNTVAVREELLSDVPNAGSVLASMTLSFYPNATRHDLRLVLAVVAVFVVVLNIYRHPHQIKRLLGTIAIIGGAVACLALAQDLFGNGKIYWFIPTYGSSYSGPFINHSHYAQYMSLSMGAALALIMVKFHEAFTHRKVTPPVVAEYLASPGGRAIWLLIVMAVLGAATVFVSLTRGGMVSMLIAGAFTTLVLSSRQSLKGRGWIMALMSLGCFICILYIGFDAVYDRLATLRQLHVAEGGRSQIVRDIAVAWTRFPTLGTGLGTHEVVYPMFDRSTIPALAAHAENEYAQAAEETGLVGLLALVVFGGIVWFNYVRNVRSAYKPIRSASYGLGFGLVAIMVHSLSDFGQHLPANAMLSAISCALLLAIARTGHKDAGVAKAVAAPSRARVLAAIALVLSCTVWAWALFGANSARLADAHWEKALAVEEQLTANGWQGDDEQYIELIASASAAADCQPDNVEYRHWLNVYRWRSITRLNDPNTGEIIMVPQTVEFARRIADELHVARTICPTYGATYCVLGQIEESVLEDPGGAERIRAGYRLAPCDPTVCFALGLQEAEQDRPDAAYAKLSRAVELDGRLFVQAAQLCVNHMDRPDLAVAMAGDNMGRLSQVAGMLAEDERHAAALVRDARARVVEMLEAKAQQADASAWVFASLAGVYRSQDNASAAIKHYRRALALDYGQVSWRFSLARLLAENGSTDDAIREARICLRLRPQFEAAKRLIADLSVRSDSPEPPEYKP